MQQSKTFYKPSGTQLLKKPNKTSYALKDLVSVPTQLPTKLYGKKKTIS